MDGPLRDEICLVTFDEMWKNVLSCKNGNGMEIFPNLKALVGYIRSLPHFNAAAEKTFSLLPDISTKKRNSLSNESFNALAIVKLKSAAMSPSSLTNKLSEDQLSLMSSNKLYQPPKKKPHLLNLHAGSTDNEDDIFYEDISQPGPSNR
ncbi:unnamed protein product [Brassicogethes aeneus]|uniref:HAT C-terminal dimerisation domain-containing protein n=1 Tax=Brassicogethes aeneus TaxID=1431903 RepID=A0A9P0FC41_BRAAE|nr:unnamed protein product [Brassicogethes aeneus]